MDSPIVLSNIEQSGKSKKEKKDKFFETSQSRKSLFSKENKNIKKNYR